MESAESAKAEECAEKNYNISGNYCPAYYDGLLCWDPTPWDTLAVQNCFSEFHGVLYDSTREYTLIIQILIIICNRNYLILDDEVKLIVSN